ncbi:hypothetical protein POM88_020682 [Heracleum sosnowskyi]|uniref:Uncharacterized protein n=1 Tax=Heracleum sosnowskyi TaxID=360622 RepID=A0AAD8IEE3_9APIA|nr:hypothetical protein POM88_020682 [Heracleum sosnowskyi]
MTKQDATTGENNAISKKKETPRPKKKNFNTNAPKPTDVSNVPKPTDVSNGLVSPVVTDGHVTQPQPSVNAGKSQGGIFRSFSQPTKPANAPLGIQPCQGQFKGKQTTGLRQIETARNARKATLAKQPVWKL